MRLATCPWQRGNQGKLRPLNRWPGRWLVPRKYKVNSKIVARNYSVAATDTRVHAQCGCWPVKYSILFRMWEDADAARAASVPDRSTPMYGHRWDCGSIIPADEEGRRCRQVERNKGLDALIGNVQGWFKRYGWKPKQSLFLQPPNKAMYKGRGCHAGMPLRRVRRGRRHHPSVTKDRNMFLPWRPNGLEAESTTPPVR